MHGLSSDFDSGFLVRRILERVRFTENQLILHFDEHLTITVESAYTYRGVRSEIPVNTSNVMHLLGDSVKEARPDPDGSLRLEFDRGDTLIVHETGPEYESFQIAHGGKVIIV